MADQPLPVERTRRPEVQHVPGPLGPSALRFGLRAALLAPLGAAASVALLSDPDPKAGSFLPLVVVLTIAGVAVTFLPWERLAGGAWGRQVLYVWAGLDVVLITLAGWSATGVDVALPLGYAVAIVFFAAVFPRHAQIPFLAAVLACYAGVLMTSGFEFLSFAMLAILGALACFVARELRRRIGVHERARIDAERRWSVVGAVATKASELSMSDPVAVLEGVVDAVALLGYRSTAIHLPDGEGRTRVLLPAGTLELDAAAVRSLPQAVGREVLDTGRSIVVTTSDADQTTLRALDSSELQALAAVPIVTGDRVGGILLAGDRDRDSISPREIDTFSMLAAQAAVALMRAQRSGAEEGPAAEHAPAEADDSRGEIVRRLSEEVRKPLAVVTDTTKALQDPATGDRERLLERLAAGANALDVTLGGLLDVSLLNAGTVSLDVHEVDLGAVVTAVAERLSGSFVDRELRLAAPDGFTVDADPALIERAIENLLATAASAAAPGHAVDVAVTRADGRVVVTVAGDGTIPPELVARIFEPFGNGTSAAAGPVIRLALAAKILELHGSELEIRSEPGEGTRVWFRIPGERAPGLGFVGIAPLERSVGDVVPLAAAARAALDVPPPPVDDEEERERQPGMLGAAAAALATAASTMIVTGVVPDLVQQPQTVTTSVPEIGGKKAEHAKNDGSGKQHQKNGAGANGNGQTSAQNASSNGGGSGAGGSTDGGSTSGTGAAGDGTGSGTSGTGGTGGTGGAGTGGGGTPAPSPGPSPSPSPSNSPGKSGEAPGHNKSPSPSPTP
jgi:signal transduction histidine kinase